jgi:magnesium-transporting ATPase (P-type)
MNPYQMSSEQLYTIYKSNKTTGLSNDEAKKRLKEYGPNTIPEGKEASLLNVFFDQFRNPLIYILLMAAGLILLLGDPLDASIISGILFFNAIIGTLQEGRAHTILHSLRQFIRSDAVVRRNGETLIIPDTELVLGDIIMIREGEKITADARLIENHGMIVDEAMLTGESIGIEKHTNAIDHEYVQIADQKNMLFRGTYILFGYGTAIVTATGKNTEIGKLGITVEEIKTETPLKAEIDALSGKILMFVFGICSCMFIFGIAIGTSFTELLVMLTALFICIIPEGLPTVLTITLVTGASAMAKKNVLIKRLQAVEGIGRASVIMIDKTGTLTRNELIVSKVYTNHTLYTVTGQGYKKEGTILLNGKPLADLTLLHPVAIACALLDHSEKEYVIKQDIFHVKGEPLEAALGIFAQKAGVIKAQLNTVFIPLKDIPFDRRLWMQAGFYDNAGTTTLFVMGTPEAVFVHSCNVDSIMHQEVSTLLHEGYRVIAIAEKKDVLPPYTAIPSDLTVLALVAVQDSIRSEVAASVKAIHDSHVHMVMATGDHKETALYVAKKVGIFSEGDLVLDGHQLDALSDTDLEKSLDHITVFSRTSAQQKLRVIYAFQKKGKTVAMTGDGINDAPALVAADLGIAMGRIGTEVAKQASDMVLLDDSLTSIIDAIQEGRHVFYTLRRVVLYFFTTNLGEVFIVLFALLLRLPLPITAAQILWLNLITDGFLNAALSMEPHEETVLQSNTFIQKHLVDTALVLKILYLSLPMGIGSIGIFLYYYQTDLAHARTMVLITMAMYQWFNAWNCRSEKRSIFTIGLYSNAWLITATLFVFGLQFFLLTNTIMQSIFETEPLTLNQWLVIVLLTAPLLLVEELRKQAMLWYHNRESIVTI